ncbi:hypothetical protein CYY_005896 [Polysphondylium violaceum]|uniref:Seipin n=1 Tax=Polysphondylium violaceum TaxID=133409 RepID=A0A8J4UYI0_9MYCE|nr:hypothetical protein CYY_005896 [Polysphondylium violaceum]
MESFISRSIKWGLELTYSIVSFILRIWLVPINSVLEWSMDRIKPIFEPLIQFVKDHKSKMFNAIIYSIVGLITISFIFFLSAISYYFLYSYTVPKVTTIQPLYFDLSNKKMTANTEVAVEFQRKKLYNIFLELEVPESPKNEDIGMFMACMDLDNQDKWSPQKIHHSCRPAILKYSSPFLKGIKSFIMTIPYLFGAYEEKQYISIPMVENLLSTRFYQSISATVNILKPEIQFYKAQLVFMAQLSGLDYYLYYYPIFSAVIGISIIFSFYMSCTVFFVVSLYLFRYFRTQPELEVVSSEEEDEEEEEEEEEGEEQVEGLVGDELFGGSPKRPSWEKESNILPHSSSDDEEIGSSSSSSRLIRKRIFNNNNNNLDDINSTSATKSSSPSTSFSKYRWDEDEEESSLKEIIAFEQKKYEKQLASSLNSTPSSLPSSSKKDTGDNTTTTTTTTTTSLLHSHTPTISPLSSVYSTPKKQKSQFDSSSSLVASPLSSSVTSTTTTTATTSTLVLETKQEKEQEKNIQDSQEVPRYESQENLVEDEPCSNVDSTATTTTTKEEEKEQEQKEEEVEDEEEEERDNIFGSDQESGSGTPQGNSGFVADEWVKISTNEQSLSDSNLRKRK